MLYGLYLSAQGADAASFRQAVLANNLANAQTTAFKRDIPVFRAHAAFDVENGQPQAAPDTIDDQTGGVSVEGTVTSFDQGSLKTTGDPFHLAIMPSYSPDGIQRPVFLEVGAGKQRFLTRNGNLSINADNLLSMSDTGLPVLTAEGEAIEIPPGMAKLEISPDGIVTSVDGASGRLSLGQLSLVQPTSPEMLMKEGDSLYLNLGKSVPAAEAEVRQGVLEESDVDPVGGMLELIQSSRGFEMNMNLVRMQDEMLAQLLQTIPRK